MPSIHCDPPEESCSFVKEWTDDAGVEWQQINYDCPESLGFRDVEGAVVACVTHGFLAPGWAYQVDTVAEMIERTRKETMQHDYTERTGPVVRVGVITKTTDEAAVAAFAQEQVNTDQWPDLDRDPDGRGWVATFDGGYL